MVESVTSAVDTSKLNQIKQETNPSKASLDGKKLAEDFTTFLKLLTTQLQNQDPTEPLDTNEFTSQLVQFASVEQEIAANKNLEKLVDISTQTRVDAGVSYIGKAIDAKGNTGFLTDGSGVFAYELPVEAREVNIVLTDSTGRAVFSGDGQTSKGKNLAVWDGVNSFTGADMPNGEYRVNIIAKDFDGKDIEAKTYTTGRVTAAEIDEEGNMVLNVGTVKVPVEDVTAIREVFDFNFDEANNNGSDQQTN